jgi:diacylglycerol kinase family enzyme
MRALLVVNPHATTTTRRTRDVLASALESEVKVEIAETSRRGHAVTLAREAAVEGLDLVVALGGDGTVNEVVNGLLHAGPDPAAPALAVVPGGSTNVFSRALGLPRDPVEATGQLLDALRSGSSRRIGLGRADERWFTFCAGMGIDAEVIRRVERSRRHGRRTGTGLYLRSTVAQYFGATERRRPPVRVHRPHQAPAEDVYTVIVSNTTPWTYLGDRPVLPTPRASFDTGLDVLALRALRLPSTLRTVRQLLTSDTGPHGRRVMSLHDVTELALVADRPLAVQVDGDYLGERERLLLRAVPQALRVVC